MNNYANAEYDEYAFCKSRKWRFIRTLDIFTLKCVFNTRSIRILCHLTNACIYF